MAVPKKSGRGGSKRRHKDVEEEEVPIFVVVVFFFVWGEGVKSRECRVRRGPLSIDPSRPTVQLYYQIMQANFFCVRCLDLLEAVSDRLFVSLDYW
jgi:hypothetical protein